MRGPTDMEKDEAKERERERRDKKTNRRWF